jgi:hypothetical protein
MANPRRTRAWKETPTKEKGPEVPPRPRTFQSRNPSRQEYRKLSEQQQLELWRAAREKNLDWLTRTFRELKAGWVMVIDGEVTRFGTSLGDFPSDAELTEIEEATRKFPFVFLSDELLAVEEQAASWAALPATGDFYPTLPLSLTGDTGRAALVADLDTGSRESFVDFDWLVKQRVTRRRRRELRGASWHLNRPFHYVLRQLTVELTGPEDTTRRGGRTVIGVREWTESPFVQVNPHRVALVGRGVLLALKPLVRLDFAARQTGIDF